MTRVETDHDLWTDEPVYRAVCWSCGRFEPWRMTEDAARIDADRHRCGRTK